MGLTRRGILAWLAATAAGPVWANAPDTSLRPVAREWQGSRTRPQARVDTAAMIRAAGMEGQVGFVISDSATGRVLESIEGDLPQPPASVTKAVTALYALEALGADYRFATRVLATGPIVDGVLEGDLILAGGADPNLVTDQLYELSETLAAVGLTEVRGDFLVWGGALREVAEIDPQQLDHLGYNPTVSGLNLNYNRVHFEWKRANGDYTVAMDARSETRQPPSRIARMQIIDREVPVYTYRDGGDVDLWTVARGALGSGGSRWLPVREPALYVGEIFAVFMKEHGLSLPGAKVADTLPEGREIARYESDDLRRTLRDMLRFSTNLTAEVAGMAATGALTGQTRGLRTSAFGMTRWAADRAGITAKFVDHSGLGDQSRISAAAMVQLLSAPDVRPQLAPILRNIPMRNKNGDLLRNHPGQVVAKTGTLNFVSSLAGYLTPAGGQTLAFAFFAADLEARERGKASGDEQPRGSISFNTKAKRLQQDILQRWGLLA